MRLEIGVASMTIHPETPQDIAYLRDTLKIPVKSGFGGGLSDVELPNARMCANYTHNSRELRHLEIKPNT